MIETSAISLHFLAPDSSMSPAIKNGVTSIKPKDFINLMYPIKTTMKVTIPIASRFVTLGSQTSIGSLMRFVINNRTLSTSNHMNIIQGTKLEPRVFGRFLSGSCKIRMEYPNPEKIKIMDINMFAFLISETQELSFINF